MKNLVAGILCVLMSLLNLRGATDDPAWKGVDDAIKKGLPRTALTNLEPILARAQARQDYPELVKAIGMKVSLQGMIEGGKAEENVRRMQAEIAKAPPQIAPVLEVLEAHWFWYYFQQNRWRFLQRTGTSEKPGNDFTTWDLPRLFAEIDKHYQKALSAAGTLKTIPIAKWDDLLEKGTVPDAFRPTLYDFVAHEALDFYSSGEQAGAKPENAFELDANSPALGDAAQFLNWQPPPSVDEYPELARRAIALFQDLLRFHQQDPAPRTAFAHVDLERLTWAWNKSAGENKDERYKTALRSFLQANPDTEVAAFAFERLGRVLQSGGDLAAAREEAMQGARRFPGTQGGNLCQNLVTEIESKSASISTERVWNAPWPEISVSYRNIDRVYFRAVPYDWATFLERSRNRPENMNQRERREVLQHTPALEWQTNLPPTTDFKERTARLPAPTSLAPGYYIIIASHNQGFSETNNVISFCDVWVSDLAMVTRTHDGAIEGFVLAANSGEPLAGAEVNAWYLDTQRNRVQEGPFRTDTNGWFTFRPQPNRMYLLRAKHQGRELAIANDMNVYGGQVRPDQTVFARTFLFTDRAIYRPGQTISIKGICISADQSRDKYEPLKGERVQVGLYDPNNKEISHADCQANDYGSFSCSFTAPASRLLGQMTIRVMGRAEGSASVRVEEYKRPKFEVKLDLPSTASKLNEKVTVAGHATSYTGAAVDGAKVNYRVVRLVRMPPWFRFGWGGISDFRRSPSQEIAHGTTKTATDGSFSIDFVARPDPKIPEKDEPSFVFQVTADVTDSTGETRSHSNELRLGYTALEAMMQAADWLTQDKPVELTVNTHSLEGAPRATSGSIRVYRLQQPQQPHRAGLADNRPWLYSQTSTEATNDLSNPDNWPLGDVASDVPFQTGTNGEAKVSVKLGSGAYRALLETKDAFGKTVSAKLGLTVLAPEAQRLDITVPYLFKSRDPKTEPGNDFMAIWGTGYEQGRAFIEIEHKGKFIERYWTDPSRTQQQIKMAVTESMRGGFIVHVTFVRENRAYLTTHKVNVPWSNKQLELRWEHFVSKLQPAAKESWTLQIRSTNSDSTVSAKTAAELVATLYDESLDAFAANVWQPISNIFREDSSTLQARFENGSRPFAPALGRWMEKMIPVDIRYRSFPPQFVTGGGRMRLTSAGGIRLRGMSHAFPSDSLSLNSEALAAAPTAALADTVETRGRAKAQVADYFAVDTTAAPAQRGDLGQVTARKNLNETAFFYPQLLSDENGVVRISFTMPEALTRWHLMALAHDKQLRSGMLEDHVVTATDLMVQPNPPRFLREGDTVEFTVKVSNQSEKAQKGAVRLNFSLAENGQSADASLGNNTPEQTFEIPAKQSRGFSWHIAVPDGCGFLAYKAVAAGEGISDGEEGAVPVLPRRILITESLPLPIRGPATKQFTFEKLVNSAQSKTLKNQSLTLQAVSNPAWYAVLALPYLMEYPYECSEQVFNRLYANSLARTIAQSNPRIRAIFDQWKNTPALVSPLEKNQDLKSVMLEETPWVRQAEKESEARHNIGILFDDNRLNNETESTLRKLGEMQLPDGSWPWFPGGYGNDYITLYITTGFGRLRELGVQMDVSMALRSIQHLDEWMRRHYEKIQEGKDPQNYVPSSIDCLYLYGRSFFLRDVPVASGNQPALQFFLHQAREFWLKTGNRQSQAHLAIALKRFSPVAGRSGDATPMSIMRSLKERSVTNEEMGMFWRDTERSWWWYHAPIETQALMIEAFETVAGDANAAEECRVWLIKQKQTQNWKTTKATADAVYALLLSQPAGPGSQPPQMPRQNLLSSEALLQVKLDDLRIQPGTAGQPGAPDVSKAEPGTGFFEARFTGSEIRPQLGRITLTKTDQGVAWASLHWQYFEDMSKVTAHEGTPLKLTKTLFRKVNSNRGPVLEPLTGVAAVGDEIVVRIELRTDRDMEYVHLKDQRGSGTEPVNVLSQYKYQDGLAYYESTRDTASHFFIDYLPRGTYVFEYSTRVQLRGEYQSGVAEIQCMYAPEFNSHSQGTIIRAK